MSDNTKGFTITEIIIVVTVGTLVALVLFATSMFMFAGILKAQTETNMLAESQNILRRVVEDMRTASAILDSNTIADPNEPAEGWVTSNVNLILIVSDPAVARTDRTFVINDLTGNPYQNEFIYFAQGSNLYKRVLANPAVEDNLFSTTCPASLQSCTQTDPHLTSDFKSMSFEFYDQNGALTENPTEGRSIRVLIELERNVFGEPVSVNNSIRMTLRNPFLN